MSADRPRYVRAYSEARVSDADFEPFRGITDEVHVWKLADDAPTMTVNLQAGDPDNPTWTDLDVS